MRTNIDIDDELMRRAMSASGAPTKKAAVEAGLQMLLRIKGQSAIRELRGKVQWVPPAEDWSSLSPEQSASEEEWRLALAQVNGDDHR